MYNFIKKNIHWIIIIIGAILRIREYLANRSLDIDEAQWALLIINHSIRDFFTDLGTKAAPPFFLILEKLAVQIFGSSEYSLRLFPLILGLFSLILFYKVAKSFLPKGFALLALSLFALSDYLILYSNITKQYSADIFFVLLILLATCRLIDKKEWSVKSMIILIAAGAVAPWFSYTSILILTGAALSLIMSSLIKKEIYKAPKLLLIFIPWGISLAFFYFFHYRFLGEFENYHAEFYKTTLTFAPIPASLEALNWYFLSFKDYFSRPLELSFLNLGIILFLIGLISSFTNSKVKFMLLSSPLLLVLIASNQQKWPFFERFILFTVPTTLILITLGIQFVFNILDKFFSQKFKIAIVLLISGLLLINPLIVAVAYFINPRFFEEIKPAIKFLSENKKSGDLLYVYYGAKPAFRYYSTRYNISDMKIHEGIKSREKLIKYIDDLNKLSGGKRVWILFSHVYADPVNEEEFIIGHLNTKRGAISSYHSIDSSVYLFDLSSN